MIDIISEKTHGGSAHLVGLSLGAQLGLQMLGDLPEIIKSTFLSSPMLKPVFGSNLSFYNEMSCAGHIAFLCSRLRIGIGGSRLI